MASADGLGSLRHAERASGEEGRRLDHRSLLLYGPGNLRFLTGIQELPTGGPPGAIRREIDVRNQVGKVLRRWIVNGWGSGQNMVHDRDYVYDQTGPLVTRLGDAQAIRREIDVRNQGRVAFPESLQHLWPRAASSP